MSKLDKRAISTILVIAILALSFVLPLAYVSATLTTVNIDKTVVQVGDVITVSGPVGQVTSGATIKGYWDIAMGEGAQLMNTTTGKPDGHYSFEITVPETLNGTHWIWVEDTATQARVNSTAITVLRKVKLKPSRGLASDEFTVTGTGFSAENDITLVFHNGTNPGNTLNYTKTYTETPITDEYGSFTVKLTVPSVLAGVKNYGTFTLNASDDVSEVNATATYIVGPSIVLTVDEGPEGTVIGVTGEGFTALKTLSVGNITWDDTYSMKIVDSPITIDSTGKFSGEIVVPSWGIGSYEVNVSDKNVWANETFAIDGEAKVKVDPSYGAPGATITVKGYNFTQIAGLDVTVTLNTTVAQTLVTATTRADGTWEDTFTAPAVYFKNYKINATDEYVVWDDTGFKVGLIAMIINPTSGPSGREVALTGIGFANGDYNMSFGAKEQYLTDTVVNEAISDFFFIPTTDPGVPFKVSGTVISNE